MTGNYLTRRQAAAFITNRGIPLAPGTLGKYATVGGGPRSIKFGRRVLYSQDDLTDWIVDRIRASNSPDHLARSCEMGGRTYG